ncbi:TetR/AcrR family transcriptional regulator [Kribbella sp. NPDC051587]|uniref:TetR/AcrR family transcriptional regulator n=1 Tax=Kribbella sp. NPDC051587 TaxID=3364119 RepID=UPI0037B57EEC
MVDLIWERAEPPERRVPGRLSRVAIVNAALTLADADGLEAVSVRNVAGALDVGPMRLYRYVDTKDELLDLLVDAVYAEIPPATGSTWSEVLRSIAHGTRDAALQHPWFAELLGRRPQFGPAALARTEASLTALRATGLEDVDLLMGSLGALNSYVSGAVRKELTERRAEEATGLNEREYQHLTGPYLTRMFATGNYPSLERSVRDARHLSPAESFELGLDLLIDGIARRLG